MISTIVTLQYLVDTLEEKCPEAMQWAIVVNALGYVCCIVMVWAHDIFTIELEARSLELDIYFGRSTGGKTYVHELNAILSQCSVTLLDLSHGYLLSEKSLEHRGELHEMGRIFWVKITRTCGTLIFILIIGTYLWK